VYLLPSEILLLSLIPIQLSYIRLSVPPNPRC
jgi:hypothetical protein